MTKGSYVHNQRYNLSEAEKAKDLCAGVTSRHPCSRTELVLQPAAVQESLRGACAALYFGGKMIDPLLCFVFRHMLNWPSAVEPEVCCEFFQRPSLRRFCDR